MFANWWINFIGWWLMLVSLMETSCFLFLWAESARAAILFSDMSNCSKELKRFGVNEGRNPGGVFLSFLGWNWEASEREEGERSTDIDPTSAFMLHLGEVHRLDDPEYPAIPLRISYGIHHWTHMGAHNRWFEKLCTQTVKNTKGLMQAAKSLEHIHPCLNMIQYHAYSHSFRKFARGHCPILQF